MHYLWAGLLFVIGLLFLIGGTLKSNFILYRLLVARSKMLWGEHVHTFYQVSGAAMMVVGILMAIQVI